MLRIVDPGRRATVLDATAAALLLRGSDAWFGPGERRRHRDQVAAADSVGQSDGGWQVGGRGLALRKPSRCGCWPLRPSRCIQATQTRAPARIGGGRAHHYRRPVGRRLGGVPPRLPPWRRQQPTNPVLGDGRTLPGGVRCRLGAPLLLPDGGASATAGHAQVMLRAKGGAGCHWKVLRGLAVQAVGAAPHPSRVRQLAVAARSPICVETSETLADVIAGSRRIRADERHTATLTRLHRRKPSVATSAGGESMSLSGSALHSLASGLVTTLRGYAIYSPFVKFSSVT